jgi:hypothetical protein
MLHVNEETRNPQEREVEWDVDLLQEARASE